jgi:DNA repair exonuclease SbcCD nuclease subunit
MQREVAPGVGNRGSRPSPIVIAHSSDLHIDDDEVKGPDNGLVGLRLVLETARESRADLVLLAGDTFDNLRVSSPVLRAAAEIVARAPMLVVLLPGNHDPTMEDCLYRRSGLSDLGHVRIFGVSSPDRIAFEHLDLEILGRAHTSYGDMSPLPLPRPRSARWQVVMAHGHYVAPDEWDEQSHRSWLISDEALAATGADYVALGHWDRPSPAGDGRVQAYYSGSPDLARTLNLVRLAEPAGVTVERVQLRRV